MRLSTSDFRQRINGNCRIEFSRQAITSYSGLELLLRYLRSISFVERTRRAFATCEVGGDFSVTESLRLLLALIFTGGSRLDHVRFLASDPLVKRFCGLLRLPTERSLSRWLKRFRRTSVKRLKRINEDLIIENVATLSLPRITLDVDGTPISCGKKVGWAARGYNPHNRHAKSYYPLLTHIAQTGHFLSVTNRPGNVHDSTSALATFRTHVNQLRERIPHSFILEARFDSAFFQKEILGYLLRERIEFAMKVPLMPWLNLKPLLQERQRWHRAGKRLSYFVQEIHIKQWNLTLSMTFYRHKVADHPPKAYQYDLFSPDDGVYEYSVLVSNKKVRAKTLWEFYNGRCGIEGHLAELKQECAFGSVPTNHYGANSAFQQISVLAYNLIRNFQIDTGLAHDRKRSAKRTGSFSFQSLKTLRFKMIAIAGRLTHRNHERTLRLNDNPAIQELYKMIESQIPYKQAA